MLSAASTPEMEVMMRPRMLAIWQEFHETGRCDESEVAPPVLRSWQRCVQQGMVPWGLPAEAAGPPAVLPVAFAAQLRATMEDVCQYVEGSPFVVLLCDTQGRALELLGDAAMAASLERMGLGRGTSWAEERAGTSAIDLALREAQPMLTCGAEHYRIALHGLACAAAPLFDVDGAALGVLAMVGAASSVSDHTLGVVTSAVHALHNQLRSERLLAEANNHLAELNAAIEAMNEGLIFVNAGGIVQRMNSRAGQMLGVAVRGAAGRPLADLINLPAPLAMALSSHSELSEQEVLFIHPGGPVAVICSLRLVWDRGRRLPGALITLRPVESVHRLVHRVLGAHAQLSFTDIVGESVALQVALREARVAALSEAHVNLVGESGVGKDLFAQAIHNASTRSAGPFVSLNCAATPRALLMGELFGYEGDGEHTARPGRFELAAGGTLYLEEVATLPVAVQTELLRAIETRHIIRVGGQRVVPVYVRLITTSARELSQETSRLRADLAHRLSGRMVRIPPLRERGDDLLLLLNRMLVALGQRVGRQVVVAPDALEAMRAYPWPGNVRELESTLEELLHRTEHSVLTRADLPPHLAGVVVASHTRFDLWTSSERAEREAILAAGRRSGGHLSRTALELGISRTTLWRKMRRLGLTRELLWQ